MRSESLFSLCLLPLLASASPVNFRRGASGDTVQVDFTRKQANPLLKKNFITPRQVSAPLTPTDLLYTIPVKIGTPAQSFDLILDTGSSDIWAYAPESSSSCSNCTKNYFQYSKSTSLQKVNDIGIFNISYGTPNSGVVGFYANDTVSVSGSSVKQIIGVATKASEGDPENGIFGIGPGKNEAVLGQGYAPFPTFTDSLVAAGLIKNTSYSIWLNGKDANDDKNGSILFGGTDSSKYTGSLVAFPIVIPAPNGQVTLDIAEPALSYNLGSGSVSVAAVSNQYTVLLDTGTAITRLPTAQFTSIAKAANAQLVSSVGIYVVDCSLAKKSGGVSLGFSSTSGKLSITVPWSQLANTADGLPDGTCIFGLLPQSQSEAEGLYIFGDTFLRSTYMYFDYEGGQVSLAQIKYDH